MVLFPSLWTGALCLASRYSQNQAQKTEQQFICYYPAFQKYVAIIPAPTLRTFHVPQFNKPGFSVAHLSDTSDHRRNFVKLACAAAVSRNL